MGGTYYKKFNVRIGIVCDQVLYDSLKTAAEFIYIAPTDGWRETIKHIDLMLVVSTWSGLHGDEWHGLGIVGNSKRKLLLEIIRSCRDMRVPTVFYSKEDPPNYKVFLDFAKQCDVVFTSAEEMCDRYQEDCGHNRVYVLPFCVNPELQNPVGCQPFKAGGGVAFSGSWIMKYPGRCRDLCVLLDGVIQAKVPLKIVNRNSFRGIHPNYRFPRRFRRFLHSAIPHNKLQAFHRQHAWSINVNSVTTSATMFAGRCYELLACGCPVLSNFSVGMLERLPEVAIADTSAYVAKLILNTTPQQLQLRRAAGIRRVMTGETCYDRIGTILQAVGIRAEQPSRSVLVVIPERTETLLTAFGSQTFSNRELCLESEFSEEKSLRYDYIIRWKAGEIYGPYYLQDLIDAFKYTDADFVTAGGGFYESISKSREGHTMFRVGVRPVRGFAVPVLNETEKEIAEELDRAHEITRPVIHTLDAFSRQPFWSRALACYMDNGLAYTIRRIFWGRQY